MDVPKSQALTICRHCRKDIKTEAWKCVPCEKLFHPSCHKLHKVYNAFNELIPCKGKSEVFTVSVAKDNSKEVSNNESGQLYGNNMSGKIDDLYKMIKEIKDDMIGKNLIKNIITEVINEEINRVKQEIMAWKETELELLISKIVRKEVKMIADVLPSVDSTQSETRKKESYSEVVAGEREAVIIIKPKDEDGRSSEVTKKEIKNKIDVSKLGVGITKMKKSNKRSSRSRLREQDSSREAEGEGD